MNNVYRVQVYSYIKYQVIITIRLQHMYSTCSCFGVSRLSKLTFAATRAAGRVHKCLCMDLATAGEVYGLYIHIIHGAGGANGWVD